MSEQQEPYLTKVTAAQVRAARFRLTRDAARGRPTPDRIARLAQVVLPGEAPQAAPQAG